MAAPVRVLILEDDPLDVQLMLRTLSQDGLELKHWVAETEEACAEHLRDNEIDIVLADYSLPNLSAPAAIRLIQDGGYDIPVIVISGKVGEETAVDTIKRGATDYVMKDRLSRLGPAIQRALGERTLRRERDLARSELEVERKLRESQDQFHQLADSIRDVYWLIDMSTESVVYVSAAFESTWRSSPEELQDDAWAWMARVHADDLSMVQAAVEGARAGDAWDIEFRMVLDSPDETRWIHSRGFPVGDQSGVPERLAAVSEDITDQRRADESTDLERRRIGAELHDSVSQELAGVRMLVGSQIESLAAAGHPMAESLRHVGEGLDRALREIRQLIRGLLPVEMDSEGLEAALLTLCESTQKSFDVRCVFDCASPVAIDDHQAATNMFRIAQGAISNAIRHSGAQRIEVSLAVIEHAVGSNELHLTISDNGSGFDMTKPTEGRGLRIMRYRARSIGAFISFDSSDQGTVVAVRSRRTGHA